MNTAFSIASSPLWNAFPTRSLKTAPLTASAAPTATLSGTIAGNPLLPPPSVSSWWDPGGRLFVSVLGHAPADSKYGGWLPIIDDAQLAASPDATTYSAAKIGEIANGLSRSMGNMGSSLSAGITAVGNRLSEKADLVNGCVRMNDYNVMGFVKFLDSEDPSLIHDAGYYAIVSTDSGWAANAIPTGEYHGLLEVPSLRRRLGIPTVLCIKRQLLFSLEGSHSRHRLDPLGKNRIAPGRRNGYEQKRTSRQCRHCYELSHHRGDPWREAGLPFGKAEGGAELFAGGASGIPDRR